MAIVFYTVDEETEAKEVGSVIDLTPAYGVERMQTTYSNANFTANITLETGIEFAERIAVAAVPGLHLVLKIDLQTGKFEQGISYAGNDDAQYYLMAEPKDFSQGVGAFTGLGPLYQEIEEEEALDMYMAAYGEGFDEGYSQGYADGLESGSATQVEANIDIDPAVLREAAKNFPGWVNRQSLDTSTIFSCGADVRMDLPFPESGQLFSALLANHDCVDSTLFLTIVLDRATKENFVGYVGASLSKASCQDVDIFEETIACEFEIPAYNANFGILFKGGFNPVFYYTDWVKNDSSWINTFNWW